MTIGPEPMTRMRCRSARRGMDQVLDDVVNGSLRSPACRPAELAVVPDENRDVDRAQKCGVAANVGRNASSLQDAIGQVANSQSMAAANVVDLARNAFLEQLRVS